MHINEAVMQQQRSDEEEAAGEYLLSRGWSCICGDWIAPVPVASAVTDEPLTTEDEDGTIVPAGVLKVVDVNA